MSRRRKLVKRGNHGCWIYDLVKMVWIRVSKSRIVVNHTLVLPAYLTDRRKPRRGVNYGV